MIGLFEIHKTTVFGMSITEEHFMGVYDSIESCLDYCYHPDNGPYLYSNRTIFNNNNEFIIGYKLKKIFINTRYSKDICEFKTEEELMELIDKYNLYYKICVC